jgi:NADPH-dependent 2,4-dienoyl-CoA reductase/sulfur reductase-like enzyme
MTPTTVVVGASVAGVRAAQILRSAGYDGNVVLVGEVAQLHQQHGVRIRLGVGVSAIDPCDDGLVLRLNDGSHPMAATVVVGIGAIPNDDWLRDSSLRIDDGVLCDAYGRAGPHVYAVGDVARWYHPRRGRALRAEHSTSAVEQAACVAHTITQPETPRKNDPIDYVWSDQYDWKVQIAGRTGADLTYVTVDREGPTTAFAVPCADSTGVLISAVVVNWPRAMVACRRALTRNTTLEEICDVLRD